MAEQKPTALLKLLDDERAALLRGDYADLDELAPSKQKLLARLGEQALSERNMQRVAHAVRRNQALLAAAIDGMRAARGRMDGLRQQRSSFSTYDKSGQRQQVDAGRTVIERKV
ncbi:hypothetical protein [Flavimaricola marinus]|uniref:FlgN protein n=1 Tax=Flavimaricola marinus TaxID=1819565 RepID=A0A238LF90_9RHOB|nr:hypothetical protein [Flavimaricola marinus]SMY08243.1 FlgN protein [Flavimaricola marinus]